MILSLVLLLAAGCAESGQWDNASRDNSAKTAETAKKTEKKAKKRKEVSQDSGIEYFNDFFTAYNLTETADSLTKDKTMEMDMFEETESPFDIVSNTHIEKEKKGDEYNAAFELNDVYSDQETNIYGFYTDDMLYYDTDNGSYKQDSTWQDVKYMIDGYNFKLYEYTVSEVNVTNYNDGAKKMEFSFDLSKLSEAPDEQIFAIISNTGTTYKNLSFNEADFEAYVTSDGYVESYMMYYDGQVVAGSTPFTFKYRTTVDYSDINNTKPTYPEERDKYEYTEVITETDQQGAMQYSYQQQQ